MVAPLGATMCRTDSHVMFDTGENRACKSSMATKAAASEIHTAAGNLGQHGWRADTLMTRCQLPSRHAFTRLYWSAT